MGSQKSNAAPSAFSSVSVNPVDPPGGITMLTPAASDASSIFYKIGTTVTFSWSYTSVQVRPTAVNVEAYCAINKYPSSQVVLMGVDFIILLPRIYRLMKLMCHGTLRLMMQMQHNLFSRLPPSLLLCSDLVQCILYIYSTRIEASLPFHQLDTLDHSLDLHLVCTNHKHIPLCPVSSSINQTNT